MSDELEEWKSCNNSFVDEYEKEHGVMDRRQMNGRYEAGRDEACGVRPEIEPMGIGKAYDNVKEWFLGKFNDSAENDPLHMTFEEKHELVNDVVKDVVAGSYDMTMEQYQQLKMLQETNDPVWAKNADWNNQMIAHIESAPNAFIQDYQPLPEVQQQQSQTLSMVSGQN